MPQDQQHEDEQHDVLPDEDRDPGQGPDLGAQLGQHVQQHRRSPVPQPVCDGLTAAAVDSPEPTRGAADAAAAMAAVPRSGFLPRSQRRYSALDLALPIGAHQTCSQPSTVRTMLDQLDVRRGHHVLDVGAGSGWTTALLAWLVGPGGTVLGVELEPSLARWGGRHVDAAGMPWARVEQAVPGVLGRPEEAPYDRILVSAEAATVPPELERQLTAGGVMVLPVGGHLLRVRAGAPGVPRAVVRLGPYLFVPLR